MIQTLQLSQIGLETFGSAGYRLINTEWQLMCCQIKHSKQAENYWAGVIKSMDSGLQTPP